MARESLTIRGYNLMEGTYRDVEVVTFRPAVTQEDNPTVSGRTGSIWRRKHHGAGGFAVNMWVGHPTETLAEVQARFDDVLRVVNQPHSLAPVVWTQSDGTTRSCDAELVGSIEPTPIGTKGFRAQLEFNIPAAYWFGVDGSASGTGTLDLPWLAASTAPMEHLRFAFTSGSNVTVTSPSTGDSFTYSGAATGVTVDSGAFTVSGGNPGLLTYTGARFLTVAPGLPGVTPQVTVSGGNVTITGKVAYL